MKMMDWILDRTNPIMLRESRELVRSRFAVGIMMTFLLVILLVSSIFVILTANMNKGFSLGKTLFQICFSLLVYTTILFIPAYTAFPFLKQTRKNGLDLLFMSTIKPRSIILGKMISAFWMLVLLFSVSMPFLFFTTFLRGVGLSEVFMSLFVLMITVLLVTMGCLILVCLPTSLVFTSLLALGYFLFLFMISGVISSFLAFSHFDFGHVMLGFGLGGLLFLPIGGALATYLISPAVSNRAFPLRLTFTICWVISGIVAAIADVMTTKLGDFIILWAVWSLFFIIFTVLFCNSEPSVLTPRVQRSIPKRVFFRWLVFPFFTGPVSAWVWCLIVGITSATFIPADSEIQKGLFAALFYAFLYSLMAVTIRRIPFFRRFIREKYTWFIAFFLLILGALLPFIMDFILYPDEDLEALWHLGNIFDIMNDDQAIVTDHLLFSIILSGLFVLINVGWIFRQIAAFRPLVTSTKVEE